MALNNRGRTFPRLRLDQRSRHTQSALVPSVQHEEPQHSVLPDLARLIVIEPRCPSLLSSSLIIGLGTTKKTRNDLLKRQNAARNPPPAL